jgi:hypothetical protein
MPALRQRQGRYSAWTRAARFDVSEGGREMWVVLWDDGGGGKDEEGEGLGVGYESFRVRYSGYTKKEE